MTTDDGLPESTILLRAGELDPAASSLHHAILRAFPRFGGPPDSAWLAQEAAARGMTLTTALAALAAADVIQYDHDAGTITAAYPFSGVPTNHQVTLAGAQPAYAMCAIDAVGIPFMLAQDGVVHSRDPQTGGLITVTIADGTAHWQPAETVMVYGTTREDGLTCERLCPTVNFFVSADAAERYLATHPTVTGTVVDQDAALRRGISAFGRLFLDTGPRTCEESRCRCSTSA